MTTVRFYGGPLDGQVRKQKTMGTGCDVGIANGPKVQYDYFKDGRRFRAVITDKSHREFMKHQGRFYKGLRG